MKEIPIHTTSSSTASPLVTPGGMVADKYRLDALIGEGGMGSVWSATHLGLNQVVAIKFVSREFVRSEEALRRFDSEAKAAAQLRSRHVVQVYDTGTLVDGTPYIAMELLHGETLQSRVHRGGPIPLGEAVEILSQCCKALGRAHGAGIIHRDIKPENIFLTQPTEDEASIVKILDFGIAKMSVTSSDQGSKQGATRTGAVLGTPLYMSPEQARALRTLDQRTDLYSLGLVAYTMFTGNLAFSSESFGDLLYQICTAPLPSLTANAAWLPPSMEGWFQRACAREPQDRYTSAQQFADALRVAAGMTLQQQRPSSMMPSQLPSGRQGPGFASSPGVSSPGTGPGISRTDDPVGARPASGKRGLGIAMGAAAFVVVAGAAIAAVAVAGRSSNAGPRAATSETPAATSPSAPTAQATATQATTATAPPPVQTAPTATAVPTSEAAPPEAAAPPPAHTAASPPHPAAHKNPPPSTTPPAKGQVDLGY